MDIETARTFLEVVKTGSFVNAAANLHLTPTAVSARVRVLEEQVDRPLFVRNKAGARLTPAGEQFQRFATTLVQVWDRARRQIALPPGRETAVTLGGELSLWSPLLHHWLLWMRRECPEVAVRAEINTSDHLMDRVEDGSLDAAVLYAAPRRPGMVAELLFEEKLVYVRTAPADHSLSADDHVHVDWGEEFEASHRAAFPDLPNSVVTINYGPLALDYILATGGSGYFRMGAVRPLLAEGRLLPVANSPEFSYSAYAVYSAKTDQAIMQRIRAGLRASAEASS